VPFYFVYIEEAHANDVWPVLSNTKAEISFGTPKDFDERLQVANVCVKALKIEFPTLVDEIGDGVGRTYDAWPDRLYVVDREGRIAYKSRPGPFGFEAEGVAQVLARIVPPVAPRP
jgi:type I thyroxine 5'-deiodinase